MVRLTNLALSNDVAQQLILWQKEIENEPDYAKKVALAKSRFNLRNSRGNPTFDHVKMVLTAMCCGYRRCAYCEDSVADEVEHMRPKALYPESTFVWENYVYACGPCNGPKNSKFAVILSNPLRCASVSRPPKATITPPIRGTFALIDPRAEDPMNFFLLDLGNTFALSIVKSLSQSDQMRAEYTLETLKLNRDYLVGSRKSAFGSLRARLKEYIQHKKTGASKDELDNFAVEFMHMHHRTVWKEMQRQSSYYKQLSDLFAEAPEAIAW